ncbi:MAG: GNAT family N-acetyltransferase, partial [Candidatus Heimdallarchaeota archaeon]
MSKQELHIRHVLHEDFQQLEVISELGFPGDEVPIIVKSLLDVEHFYVAETSDQEIVGFVIFGIYSIKTAHIMILAIHPDFQRKGFGGQLLEFTLSVIKKSPINRVRLEVRMANTAAIKFYENFNFKINATIKQYYDDNTDAYLM